MTLSEKMVFYRARERISQKELAERCGVTLQTISNVERGIQNPSRITAMKINMVVDDEMREKEVQND